MKTYIIVVTHNGMKWLSKCLESTKPYPVIVVDNYSSDGTIDFIRNRFPEVILLQQEKNLGFGQANNIGISYALNEGSDYVFLLNQDAYLMDRCIEELIKVQQKKEKFGILSPIHLNGKGTRLDQNFSNFVGYEGNKNFYSDYVLGKRIKDFYEVPFVNAAGWLISRECIEQVGGFDPIFFHYGEDGNYCQRVQYHNFKIGIVPGAFLNHDRENRILKVKKPKGNRFERNEKDLKVNFADINKPYDPELENLMGKRKKFEILSYLKLQFNKARFYRNEYNILKRLVSEIKESRRMNLQKRRPYL